ncbi:uncharacterized protein LOC105190236 isoform X1 [Harpegnathos saltator]|uniref:uncharacterized protein LOC105190236 isoform X1 n=1 Tax=Harpegnathos saltator TaxID=610380 RepID=UPI00058ED76D|nr:uncharacterized protein LOC105190236 isoform X1 [Harpegnathos saltator]
MRRASFDKHANAKRNVLSSASYGLTCSKDVEYKRGSVNYSSLQQERNYLQRSVSADNVIVRSRGFKPSDRHDPVKRNFLENLTSRILHFDMESGETTPINLQKLLTPASDSHEMLHSKNRKMFASSYFYAPTHPTVEDQVELARRISHSLSDVKNVKSKGQTMYVNRKKRSVKWIHDGNGIEDEEESTVQIHKDKLPLKCVMNPCGKVLDIHGIQALGEEVNIAPVPKNPEKLFDIVRDLNNQRGRGAEIFAKRRKRSEKWVVDQERPQTHPSTPATPKTPVYPEKLEVNGNAKLMTPTSLTPRTPVIDKPFYNPFTVDISLDEAPVTDRRRSHCNASRCTAHLGEVKKIYLREIAVGTDSDFPLDQSRSPIVEKSRRIAFEGTNDYRGNNVASNRALAINNSRYTNNSNNNCNYQPPRRAGDFYASRNNHERDVRTQRRFDNRRNDSVIDHAVLGKKQRNGGQPVPHNEENGYTPVPVKQLIQEFEKTCRPVLQYKQISPRIIPIVQQCPLDNDIARFFATKNPAKCSNEEEEEEYARARGSYEAPAAKAQSQRNGRLYGVRDSYERPAKPPQCNGRLCDVRESYIEEATKAQSRCNGYVSTDESEYTTDNSDSEADDYQEDAYSLERGDSAPSALFNYCDSEYSVAYDDEYTCRGRSAASQELEALCANGDARFVNTETETPAEAKSLMLSMVASQEDILETRKHLRNTPVLDNLLGTVTPECKLADVNPELGNKLYENNSYTGPKLASLHNLTNYNTAPRGWDQSLTFYRPIKFEKPQEIVYSDF